MTIIVTGGAGFIGSNFILEWVSGNANELVINLDKLTYAANLENLASIKEHPSYKFIRGDIGDSKLVTDLLDTYCPRAILNFAAESHVDKSIHGPSDFIATNIVGTFNLLESARGYYDNLAEDRKSEFRFLHVSTDEVYGSLGPNDAPFTELSRYAPSNPYSASKAASDHLVRSYYHTYGLPVLITNCSNNYGPNQFPEKLIPLMIHRALRGEDLPVYGDGQHVRDWLYVMDHCAAIRTVLEKGRLGEAYNIGGQSEKKNIDVVHHICSILDMEHPRPDGLSYHNQIRFVKDRPGHDRRYAIDFTKINCDLDWKPSETFENGLHSTVLWYLMRWKCTGQ